LATSFGRKEFLLPSKFLVLSWLLLGFFFWTIPCHLQAQTGAKIDSPNATPPDKVVMVVGDLKITARDTEKMLENFPPAQRSFYSGSGRRQLAEYILNSKLLTKEAEKRHLDENEEVKIRLNLARDSILMYSVRQELLKEMTATTEEAQKFEDDNITKYEEARVRRIVIQAPFSLPNSGKAGMEPPATKEEALANAEEIRKKLLEGADFEEMAAKYSSDPLSSGKGGDLGYIRRGTKAHLIVPPLEQLIFSIPIGSISEVQATALGYEIVKVEDRRKPKLEDVRKEVDADLRNQKYENLLKDMRNGQNVQIDEEYFKPVAHN
jgi:peptidyl-prolyl cis-trans isomerase C